MDVPDIDPSPLHAPQHGINQLLATHFPYGVYAQGTSDYI